MGDYANLQRNSVGYLKSFTDSFLGTVIDITRKFASKNPQFKPDPTRITAGMRKMGERLAKTLFQSGAKEIFSVPEFDQANLDEAIKMNDFELISGVRNQQGFLTQEGTEKFLHLALNEAPAKHEDLIRIFLDYFIKSTKQEINMQDLVKQEVAGLVGFDAKKALPHSVNFPVFFNGDIETVWQELWSRSQADKPDFSIVDLSLTPDLKDFFGPVNSAPLPAFRKEEALDKNEKASFSLPEFYKEKIAHLNSLLATNKKVPVVNLLVRMEEKLSKSEISLTEAAKLIVYIRKISEPLKDKLASDYETWFKLYKEHHVPEDHS